MDKMISDFNAILAKYGHDILLQRVILDSKDHTKKYKPNLERHTTRHMLPSARALPITGQEGMAGNVFTNDRVYYFKADVKPMEGDRIYEYDPNAYDRFEGDKVTYIIEQALPMRGRNGIIVYWMTGATRESPN